MKSGDGPTSAKDKAGQPNHLRVDIFHSFRGFMLDEELLLLGLSAWMKRYVVDILAELW